MDINRSYKKELIESEREAISLRNALDFELPLNPILVNPNYGTPDADKVLTIDVIIK
jgi:hypothetical protein